MLELWAYSGTDTQYVFLKSYPFTASSGDLGPKRREGDWQIPEGFYIIDHFNPASTFHLSMRIDYPNKSDKILGDKDKPGGEIRIHGSRVTIGCIPIGNAQIEELYIIALDSKDAGHEIPVHIFPCNFADTSNAQILRNYSEGDSTLSDFWKNIEQGYWLFERSHRLPKIWVDAHGKYIFTQ